MALLTYGRTGIFILFSVLCVGATVPQAYGQTSDEYSVKAAFLFNFTKFIEWLPGAFPADDAPVRICVVGQNHFGQTLENALAGKVIAGRLLLSTAVAQTRDFGSCQILFVSFSEEKRFKAILSRVRPAGTLTVGEGEGFLDAGGMVNLKLENSRVRLEINLEAATRANLRISSKLLNLARIVK